MGKNVDKIEISGSMSVIGAPALWLLCIRAMMKSLYGEEEEL